MTMPHEIKEADWKVLRRLHPLALERFSERVLAEIKRIEHDDTQSFHERYLAIYKVIELRDREMARLLNNPKRSIALTMLAQLRTEGLLAEEEFSSLSPEARSAIGLPLGTP